MPRVGSIFSKVHPECFLGCHQPCGKKRVLKTKRQDFLRAGTHRTEMELDVAGSPLGTSLRKKRSKLLGRETLWVSHSQTGNLIQPQPGAERGANCFGNFKEEEREEKEVGLALRFSWNLKGHAPSTTGHLHVSPALCVPFTLPHILSNGPHLCSTLTASGTCL